MVFENELEEGNENNSEKEGYAGYDLYPDRRAGENSKSKTSRFSSMRLKFHAASYKCEQRVLDCFKNNPLVRILYQALKDAGCPFDITKHISCEECDEKVTGGYDSEWNQIVICQNRGIGSLQSSVTLVHELIHMYDFCMNHVDFKNLEHLACSEIRAANLSHCSFISSLLLGQSSLFNIKATHQYCVKIKATESLMVSRQLDFDTAFSIILKVFDKCYNDLEPIGRRVRKNSDDHFLAYSEFKHYFGNQ